MKNQDNDNGGGKLIDWRKVKRDEQRIIGDILKVVVLIVAVNVSLCIFPQYERGILLGFTVGMSFWARYSE